MVDEVKGADASGLLGSIQVDRVSLIYRGGGRSSQWPVLSDVSLDIAAGAFVCIVGPSGCGKTSLLHCMAGLLAPSSGSIRVSGGVVRGVSRARGLVFQQFALFPWLSAVKNVEFALAMRGIQRHERRSVAMEYLELVGMSDAADVLPKALSGGMKQRVALARAYAAAPEVLLMDEPFGSLDAQTRRRLQVDLLRSWEREGRTIVFVTHDVEEAVLLGERVVVMKTAPGEIIRDIAIPLGRGRELGSLDTSEFRQCKGVVSEALSRERA